MDYNGNTLKLRSENSQGVCVEIITCSEDVRNLIGLRVFKLSALFCF